MQRHLLAVWLVLTCTVAFAQDAEPQQKSPADAMRGLRLKMLTTPPAELDIQPSKSFPRVYGVVMDWALKDVTVTIVSLADGSASLYSTSTFGIIGGSNYESVRTAAATFVRTAANHYRGASPVKEYAYPDPGRVRFYLVCFDGVRMVEKDEQKLKAGKDAYSGLWKKGQAVLTELRLIAQQQMEKKQ